jgi:hypothetical protein
MTKRKSQSAPKICADPKTTKNHRPTSMPHQDPAGSFPATPHSELQRLLEIFMKAKNQNKPC